MNWESFIFDPNSAGGSDPFKRAINAPNIIILIKRKKANIILTIFRCEVSENGRKLQNNVNNGILLPKLFWPTVRKNVLFSDWEKLLKFEAEGREFANFLRLLEQFIQTVKGQNNFW